MTSSARILVSLIVLATSHVAMAADPEDVTGVVFVAQPVRGPVALDRVAPSAPFVPPDVPEQTGTILVGPDHAAALWLEPLELVRVRHDDRGTLRFARVAGAQGLRTRIAEPGVAIESGVTVLAQPPGRGDVWMIWADRATTIHVERPLAREGRLIWDQTQRALLDWVDRGQPAGSHAPIPVVDGAFGVALELEAEAAIGATIEAAFPVKSIERAVRAWRKAGVVAALTTVRPLVAPQLAITPLDGLAGMTGEVTIADPSQPDPRPYHRVTSPRQWKLELDGPGVLRVEVRALLPSITASSRQPEPPTITVAVAEAMRGQLGRRAVAAAYATAPTAIPRPAFPANEPLRSVEGDYLGERVAVSVPLFPGRHTYVIDLATGPVVVRATSARRRVRIGEALGGRDDVDRFVDAARSALGTESSDGANLVRHLVAMRSGDRRSAARPTGKLPPLLELAWLVATGDVDDRTRVRRVLDAVPSSIGDAVWPLVLSLARQLQSSDDVRRAYEVVHGAPPASLVSELTALLPRRTPLERVRNWSLAAVEVAASARPLDPTLASATRAEWRRGEWAQIHPTLRDPDDEPPPPRRWLVETGPTAMVPPRAWKLGDLSRLVPNTPRAVTALPSAIDASRAALLDVFIATTAGEPGPFEVAVDGHRFHTIGLAPVERIQIAVAPGAHEVTLGGPPSLRGWVSQMPATPVGIQDTARVQSYWPTGVDGVRLQYPLPGGDLPLPIEVALRAVTSDGGSTKPIRVTMHADIGRPIELELTPSAADAKAHPLDGSPIGRPPTEEARFVLRLAPGARVVWFDTSSPDRVLASVSARRERSAPESPQIAAKPAPAAADLVARIAASSRTLAADPDNAHARAGRANDLLDLGEAGLAREDLIRLLRVPAARRDDSLAGLEEELFVRLDNFAEPTHVALADDVRHPIAVSPALLAIASEVGLRKWRSAALALRAQGPDEALRVIGTPADEVAAYVAARAHAARGDDEASGLELVRSYQRTDRWQVGFEAIEALSRVLADRKRRPRAGLYAVTYGIASRLRSALDHPRLRRALVIAASQSGWDTLTATSGNAGQEHLFQTAPTLPPAPAVVIREALLSPSWPIQAAHTLTPGNAAVLDLSFPVATRLRAQIYCVRIRTMLRRADAPCAFTTRLDSGAARALAVPVGNATELALGQVASGRHVLEVALASASEGDVASVRFLSETPLSGLTAPADPDRRFPIRIDRRGLVFVANAATPITTTVLGPTTLWIQARGIDPGDRGPRTIEITATPPQGEAIHGSPQLPSARDLDARGDTERDLVVSAPVDTFLVLPEASPYRIAIRPDRGEVVARMALRDERRGKIPRLPGPWYAAAPEATAPFTLPTSPGMGRIDAAVVMPPSTGRAGTLSIEMTAGQEARTDEDLGQPAGPRSSEHVFGRVEGAFELRRALSPRRAWLSARGLLRTREATAPITGGAAELYLDRLPLGTTLHLLGTTFTQRFSDGRAWHARGELRLFRRVTVSDAVTVMPGLGFSASYLNTTPEIAAKATDEVDPDVYNDYRHAHDRAATPRLAVRWFPFQDFVATAGASATTNADLRSIDNAALSLETRTLLPLPLLGETVLDLGYRPSYRLSDADRVTAYWRHDLSARAELTLWTGTTGRFVVSIWDTLAFAGSERHSFGVGLRFDLVSHRGLADFQPDEAPFASLVERRSYAPMDMR